MDFGKTLYENTRPAPFAAAHRGMPGGNLPFNSLPAFLAALENGAEIIELDVTRSTDGVLYVLHPGMEPVVLGTDRRVTQMTSEEVDALPLRNGDHTPTQYHVMRFADVLNALKGRCYINVDKFWTFPKEISEEIRRAGAEKQVLIKTSPSEANLNAVRTYAPDLPYMYMVKDKDEVFDAVKASGIRLVGMEILFADESAPVASPEYIARMHGEGMAIWMNGIVYDHRAVLAAGHNDDISVTGDPDGGWGWLLDRGADVVQTDFLPVFKRYLAERKKK